MRRSMVCIIFTVAIAILFTVSATVIAQESSQEHRIVDTISPDADVPVDVNVPATTESAIPDFEPTNEWQMVLPGQSIPAGLWVRMDVTTGEKMARLMPEEELNDQGRRMAKDRAARAAAGGGVSDELILVPPPSECDPNVDAGCGPKIIHHHTPSQNELPEPGESASDVDSVSPQSEHALKLARQERLRLLKEHFYLKEDVEQMKQLLAICIDPSSTVSDVTQALGVLEEYLHQIDNAADWTKIGGLDVSLAFLSQKNEELATGANVESVTGSTAKNNDTASAAPPAPLDLQAHRLYQLQSHAAWVLGTAAQNNPTVQEACRKEGTVQVLVGLYERVLKEEWEDYPYGGTAPTETSPSVTAFHLHSSRLKLLAKLLYALSATLRNNARNQGVFHTLKGQDLLLQEINPNQWRICTDSSTDVSTRCLTTSEQSVLMKLLDSVHSKTTNLLHDLVVDHVVNSRESVSLKTGKVIAAGVGMSNEELFKELTKEKFCMEYFRRAVQPSSLPLNPQQKLSPTHLTTRELALDIMKGLLEHRHDPASHDKGLCEEVYRSSSSQVNTALGTLEHQHDQLSAEAALEESTADDASDGQAKYHAEIKQAIQAVRRLIQ